MSSYLQIARQRSILDKEMNYGGVVMSRRQYVEEMHEQGESPQQVDMHCGRGPKGLFWFIGEYQVTQTEVDYWHTLERAKLNEP